MKIVVLLHEADSWFERTNYMLRWLLDRWGREGHEIEVVRGASRFVPADVVIPHLDLTVTPELYRELLARYPVVLNRNLVDISKTAVSRNLLRRGDGYKGQVIVKTDRNYGGRPEARLGERAAVAPPGSQPARGTRLQRVLRRFGAGVAEPDEWDRVQTMDAGEYPVFESLRDTPAGVFRNPSLVVERFLPERDGDDYCLRYCYVLGEHEVNLLLKSHKAVVKAGNAHSVEAVNAPAQLRAICRERSIDYGKLDYVLRDGEVVLFDVNRTPALSGRLLERYGERVVEHLAAALPKCA